MSTKNKINDEVIIPENVKVEVDGSLIKVKGPSGENEKRLGHQRVYLVKEGNKIIISSKRQSRNEKKLIRTFKAHITNLINGTINPYIYKLKICSGHFPMNVFLSNNKLIIKNFFAEKIPRVANILPKTEVKINGDEITIEGVDKEAVGQTASNIEQACRITNRDRRVFMDGIYIISKTK